MKKNETYGIELPERSDLKYYIIEKYEDYEYTYCIAYEMLIRTKEFKALKNVSHNERGEQWRKDAAELGLNPNMISFPEEIFSCTPLDQNHLFCEKWTSFTIDDVHDGLNRLITFYINNNELYEIKKDVIDEYGQSIYEKVKNVVLSNVMENMGSYHVPVVINNQFAKKDTSHIQAMSPSISKHLPLKILEKRFLDTLSSFDLKEKYIQTEPIFNRPLLRFQQNKIINLPVNLNLSKEELIAYMLKIKEDYDHGKTQIKNPLEIIGQIFQHAIEPNSSKELPTTKENRKIAIADAFFVFDMYQILAPYFKNKLDDIVGDRAKKIKEIQKRKDLDKDQKKYEIDNLKDGAKDDKKSYSADLLYTNIAQWGKIPDYNIKALHKFMKEYIEDSQYKTLITGVANNE
jgi:hypothetical protein